MIKAAHSERDNALADITLASNKKILLAEEQAAKNQEQEIINIDRETTAQLAELADEKEKNADRAVADIIQFITANYVGR